MSVAIIEGKKLIFREGNIDIELNRNGSLCIVKEESNNYMVYSDLKNYPGMEIMFNNKRVVLDPGLLGGFNDQV